MTLAELRKEIDVVDDTILQAFARRMEIAGRIGQLKKEQNLPILDVARENDKLAELAAKLPPELEQYGYALYSTIFELSRSHQSALDPKDIALQQEIETAIIQTPQIFPSAARVACQGIAGAYSQLACEKIFASPQIMYFKSFDNVFSAIENGLCRYGILPLENSVVGSVTQVYDLIRRYNFRIVRSARIKLDHNLPAKPGTRLQDIKQIYTRFICISRNPEIYPGADRTSLMIILPHRPGSLYRVLSRFNALGLNLIKLESRPLPDRDFEFMFYLDLQTSIYSPEFTRMIHDLNMISDNFQYLGSYSEVV